MKRIIVRKNKTTIIKTSQSTSDQLPAITAPVDACNTCGGQINRDRKYSKLLKGLADSFRTTYKKEIPSETLCTTCIKFNQEQLDVERKKLLDVVNPAIKLNDGSVINGVQKGNCYFTEVSAGSELYTTLSDRIAATLLNLKIIRIEQSLNPMLLKTYLKRKYEMFGDMSDEPPSLKFALNNKFGENYMFHGSQNKAYDTILDTGFDISFSKSTGLLGKGIYFAQNASYSDGFACSIRTDQGPVGIMLICRVVLGTKIDAGTTGIISLPIGVHSVSGTGDIYAVFNNFQAYPEFIVYYQKSNPIV